MADEQQVGPVVNLSWIFSAPIEAVIKANIMAAEEFVAFLRAYAFEPSGDDPSQLFGSLRMVTFSFEQSNGDGPPVTRLFRVALASLIPMPLLEVKDASFEFGVRVVGAVETKQPPRVRLLRMDVPADPDADDVEWRAMLADGTGRDAGGTQEDLTPHLAANLQAKVTVGQADIPAGIRNLLALMGENAQLTQAVLAVEPKALTFPGAIEDLPDAGRTIILKALAADRPTDGPPMITAYYDSDLISLSTADRRGWPSGASRATDGDGRLDAIVSPLPFAPDGRVELQTKVLFNAATDDASAVAELTCRFQAPSKRALR